MPEKKLEIGYSVKGGQDIVRQVGLIAKSLEGLKKQGIDVSKVFKTLSLDSGTIKFNKDLAGIAKTMTGLTKETKSFLSVWTDQRLKASQEQQTARWTKINQGIEKYRKLLQGVNLEESKQRLYSTNLASLMAKSNAMAPTGTWSELQKLVPTTMMGRVAFGGAAAAGSISMIQSLAGMYANYAETKASARAGNAAFMTPYIMEAYQGKSQRSAFFTQQGGLDKAGAYAQRQLTPTLVQQGHWAAAMGIENQTAANVTNIATKAAVGAIAATVGLAALTLVTGGAAAPVALATAGAMGGFTGGWMGVREAGVPSKEIRQNTKRELLQRGIQYQLQEKGVTMAQFDYVAERASHFNQMQRLFGKGIWNPSGNEMGTFGAIGMAREAGYTTSQGEKAMLDIAQRGGARAVKGRSWLEALRLQREYGIEQAPEYIGTMNYLGGGREGSVRAVQSIAVRAAQKGFMGGEEMKIETESYVAAVMAATERVMSRYGVHAGVGRTSDAVAAAFNAMLPGNQLGDIETAKRGFAAAETTMSGGANAFTHAMTLGRTMGMFGGGKMGYGLTGILASEKFQNMSFADRNRSNPLYAAMAYEDAGLPATATEEQKEAALTRWERKTASTDRAIGKIALMGVDPAQAKLRDDLNRQYEKMSIDDPGRRSLLERIGLNTPGAVDGASAHVAWLKASGRGGAPVSDEQFNKFFTGPKMSIDTLGVSAEMAEARGEQRLQKDIDPIFDPIKDSFKTAEASADSFSDSLKKLGGVGGLATDLSAGVDMLTRSLQGLGTQIGNMNIGWQMKDLSQESFDPIQVSSQQEGPTGKQPGME